MIIRLEAEAHPPDLAALDDPPRREERQGEAHGVAGHQRHSGGVGGSDDAPALGDSRRERLLEHDVPARAGGGDRHLGVQLVRQGDDDRVDPGIGQQVAIVTVALAAELGAERREPRFVIAARGDEPRGADRGERPRMGGAEVARPDDPDPQYLSHLQHSSDR